MRYAELYCRSNFSFLEGASHADELVSQAVALGYAALAVTDRNSLAGVVRAHVAAKKHGLPLIVGAEITPVDALPVVVWATDRRAYAQLARLLTLGRRRAAKGECQLTWSDVAEHAAGWLAGVVVPPGTTEYPGDLDRYREAFSERAYLLATLLRGPADDHRLAQLAAWSRTSGLPLVAAGDVLHHVPQRQALQHVLTAIRHGQTVAAAEPHFTANAQRHLRPRDDLAVCFAAQPDALRRTVDIAERCTFSLDELRYEYPEELAPAGLTPFAYLTQLTWHGADERYPGGVPEKVRRLVEHELQLIAELRYEAYFLTVQDLVRFARGRGILCQGRGSAANSAVCYCLGVTAVDPGQTDVLFERFISRERNEPPDIDIDFEHERREEVLQYLYDKYGRDRAGIAATVITYRTRSAIRDVGKALGLAPPQVDLLAKNIDGQHAEPLFADRCREAGLDPQSPTGRLFVGCVAALVGFPRHLSQHVGGMVMTQGPLCELVPIENAAMPGRTVIQWDKDDLDALGLLKVDCLALGMLTAIRKCCALIEHHAGRTLTLANIPQDDPQVYDMICRADTLGVFQIESRAQMSMLPRLRPRCYYDLVIEVAIVRPGPIQGNMVHPYLRRRRGEEPVDYPSEAVRGVLAKTLGVPIFQEQVMQLAVVAAGFTPGQADQLRRAMGAWRRTGDLDVFREQLIDGMLARGYQQQFAEQIYQQLRGFGEYGFPESHAASFALLVYVSAWLKHHHPAAFTAALLNSQPLGFYAPAQLVRDAREHGVEVRPADVCHSDWDCTLEPLSEPLGERSAAAPSCALRLGLRMISGLHHSHATTIEQVRRERPFADLADFARRTRLGRPVLLRLSRAAALDTLAHDRRTALWNVLGQPKSVPQQPLFDTLAEPEEEPVTLVPLAPQQEVFADYAATGLSLRAHPMSFYRAALDELHVTPAARLATLDHGARVHVAGIVLLRQRPSTAKGITFVTLEDETGTVNLIVHQATWTRFRSVTRHSPAWLATGPLERQGQVIHIVVHHLADLSHHLGPLATQSRDFR